MKCLEMLSGEIRRLAVFRRSGQLNVVIDSNTFCYGVEEELCQAITNACASWAGLNLKEAPLETGELANLDTRLKQPKTRFLAELKDGLYVAELFTGNKLLAGASSERLDLAVGVVNTLAKDLTARTKPCHSLRPSGGGVKAGTSGR